MATPDTSVQIGPHRGAVRAVVTDTVERNRLWPRLVDAYAYFDTYQSWAEREIPVIALKPR